MGEGEGTEDPNLKIGQLNAGLKDNFWALDDINLTIQEERLLVL